MEYLMNRQFAMFVRYLVMKGFPSIHMANIGRAYSSFYSMKQLVVLLVLLDGMSVFVQDLEHNTVTLARTTTDYYFRFPALNQIFLKINNKFRKTLL